MYKRQHEEKEIKTTTRNHRKIIAKQIEKKICQ